ncbi:hypothetical protein [Mobilicoccus pelagius]|uniref:hypothetical protein n=1 Tax=Mobilicoccus pelagius TaxID=746032 RepID=UPI0002EC0A02|nr:hypothetical protein [Mobilicoccus pelagius]
MKKEAETEVRAAARAEKQAVEEHPHGPAMMELFAQVDPWGLVEMGAPRDEYVSEVDDLLDHPGPSARDVLEVFNRWGTVVGEDPGPAEYGAHPGIREDDARRLAEGIARIRGQRAG